MVDPKTLYDATANRWTRSEPSALSDFTGRPAVFELLGDIAGLAVLDAGCGEGYCSRVLAPRGPRELMGIDQSEEMIRLAQEAERHTPRGIAFRVGDIRSLEFEADRFDLAFAVFVFNYLTLEDSTRALRELRRVVRKGGRVVFSVPHPCFPLLGPRQPPFFFDFPAGGYFDARDQRHHGEISRIDGTALAVQAVHKTFEDYFDALRNAGFERLPILRELRVLDEHLQVNERFFGPVRGLPLHVAFAIEV